MQASIIILQQMQQLQIFPNSTQFPVPVYPLAAILGSVALYYALFQFNLQKIIEKLFSLSAGISHIKSTILYLLLINFPLLLLSAVSLMACNNLMGFQISCDVDHIQIVFISAYICYIEQSRQTPIRGCLFIRDLIFTLLCLAALSYLHFDNYIRVYYGAILMAIFFVYYILQNFQQEIQNNSLKILGIKQSNVFNSNFLLTQTRKQANYLKTKSTIEEHKQTIEGQIQQFKQMTNKLYSSQDQKIILLNFAKLFLPYKIAIELQQVNQLNENIDKIVQNWTQCTEIETGQSSLGQNQLNDDEINQDDAYDSTSSKGKGNESRSCLNFNRAMTDDYVVQNEEEPEEQSSFEKIVRYTFYPLYYISTLDGRVRYFMDYLCVILLLGVMLVISISCNYFIKQTSFYSFGILSLILAIAISIPSGKYYLRISVIKDFDFINIFFQSSIIKSVFFGILTIILYLVKGDFPLNGNPGLLISVIVNIFSYCIFGAFMIAQKFATLKSNLKFLTALSVSTFVIKILGEIILNVIIKNTNIMNS